MYGRTPLYYLSEKPGLYFWEMAAFRGKSFRIRKKTARQRAREQNTDL
jgi:hypothetical protein